MIKCVVLIVLTAFLIIVPKSIIAQCDNCTNIYNESFVFFLDKVEDNILIVSRGDGEYRWENNFIQLSSDGGLTWSKIGEIDGTRFTLHQLNNQYFITSKEETIAISDDLISTYKIESESDISHISIIDSTFLITTPLNEIYKTNNIDSTWHLIKDFDFENRSFDDTKAYTFRDAIYVEHGQNLLLKSHDYGRNWDTISLVKHKFNQILQLENELIWQSIGGLNLASKDGINWTEEETNFYDSVRNIIKYKDMYVYTGFLTYKLYLHNIENETNSKFMLFNEDIIIGDFAILNDTLVVNTASLGVWKFNLKLSAIPKIEYEAGFKDPLIEDNLPSMKNIYKKK